MFYKCFISALKVFYKCFFVAILGVKLIFGQTGLRTNGPSDNKADPGDIMDQQQTAYFLGGPISDI